MTNELTHYGVKGMHWGIRRYQPYPKNYTGDGRAIGEARKAQKSIEKNFRKAHNSNSAYRNLNKNPHIIKAVDEVKNTGKKRHEALKEVNKEVEKISKDLMKGLWFDDKKGNSHININHKLVDYYLKDVDAVDDKRQAKESLKNNAWYAVEVPWEDYADSYIHDHRKNYPTYNKKYNTFKKLDTIHRKSCEEVADKLVGDMGNVPLESIYKNHWGSIKNVKDLVQGVISNKTTIYFYDEEEKNK